MNKVLELVERMEKEAMYLDSQEELAPQIPTLTKIIRLQHEALEKIVARCTDLKGTVIPETVDQCIALDAIEEVNRTIAGEL